MAGKNKCIICGKSTFDKINLSNGIIYACYSCRDILTLKINDTFPILWLDSDYLYDLSYQDGVMTKEEAAQLKPEEIITLAKDTADILCNDDYFHIQLQEYIKQAVEHWRERKEEKFIINTPIKNLPLLIGSIKYKDNQKLFEKRLKKGKC